MEIREATASDAGACSAIYNHWVRTSVGTFDETERDDAATAAWYRNHQTQLYPLLVMGTDDGIAGWGSLTPWSQRSAYARTVEISVYIDHARLRCGIGTKLSEALLRRARANGQRVVVARLESSNTASRRVFEHLGFVPVGVMHSVGYKFDRWLDVLIMQCDLQQTEV